MSDGEIVLTGQRNYSFRLPAEEILVPVTQREWNRLRDRVAALQKHEKQYFAVAWASVGVFASSAFGALAWAQPFTVLVPEQQLAFVWIWVVLAAAGFASLAAAAAMFWAGTAARRAEGTAAQQIVEDMDEIHAPPVRVSTAKPA